MLPERQCKFNFLFVSILLFFTNISITVASTCQLYSQKKLSQIVLNELRAENFICQNSNEILLTFDDGPSPAFTKDILNELKMRELRAIFFISTRNLDSKFNRQAFQNADLVKYTFNQGHIIASHGHQHNAYDLRIDVMGNVLEQGYSALDRQREIKLSYDLLNEVLPDGRFVFQQPLFFRFPYGRGAKPSQNEMKILANRYSIAPGTFLEQLQDYWQVSEPLQSIYKFGFMHLGWNHDSGDSTSTNSKSRPTIENKVKFIKLNVKNFCFSQQTKVALFHDTKSITHQTIGSLIDVANCLDLRFIKPNDLFLKSDLLENGILLGEESNLRNGISFAQVNQNEKVDYTPITYSKDQIPHVDHILNSNTKLCISTYTNKTYGQCEGVDSICFNGNWYSKNDVIIKKGCQR